MSKKIKETSSTGGTATATPGTGEQVMGKVRIRTKKIKEDAPILAGGKVKDNYAVSHLGYTPAPHVPNRKSGMIDYKQLFEDEEGFNVNKVWDFIESKPFYNSSYMPKFNTAEEIWKEWGPEEKEMYANFTWEDVYGGKIHPREKAALQRRKNYDNLAGTELNENYHRFKNETSKRTRPEQMHKAIKAIKGKLQEVDRLLEYTQQLKSEVTEGSEDFKYMKHTERTLEQITETIKQIYIKSKKIK